MNTLVHWEIPSTDLARSKEFYRKLFGWKMKSWGRDYVLFDVGDGVAGGITRVRKVPKPCIGVYVGVEDITAALAKAQKLGGRPRLPKTPIGKGMGYTGAFVDPCGCLIGLWSRD